MRALATVFALGSVGFVLGTAPAAFAQDPNAYPQQQYPQQQYPQQQYPQQDPQQQYPQQQQQYPQQPYPQQQYPQQQYPQQQTYPPAGYAAPAPAAPPSYQPAYAPPAPAYSDLRHGGVAIVTLGLNAPVGSAGDGYSAGLSIGTILGLHLSREISLNGELTFHVLNGDNTPSDTTEGLADILFAPLYHFGFGNLEYVLGPKLGGFVYTQSTNVGDYESTASGLAYGFNGGVFFQLTQAMSVGGLLSYSGHHTTKVCDSVFGVEDCNSVKTDKDFHILAFNGALRW